MKLLSYYLPSAPAIMVYMLQQVEYNPKKFLRWAIRLPDLRSVKKRGTLHKTKRAQLMLVIAYGTMFAAMLVGIVGAAYVFHSGYALLLVLFWPLLVIANLFFSTLPLEQLVVKPGRHSEIAAAQAKLRAGTATRIAVLGSYGKTTMKELLVTVLSEAKKVAATPGNKNVLISHARWVSKKLAGDEDVLIFEYGEAQPGDIAKLAAFSKPDIAVITGVAPAHMDAYPNLAAIAQDFAAIAETVKPENIYINKNELLETTINGMLYSVEGLGEWKVGGVVLGLDGTTFTLSDGRETLRLHTDLLGGHQIGPLCAVVAIAKQLGLSNQQITAGIAKTKPYQHRMQPYQLGGAWVIDDTYNGNIEGVRAGLELLKVLPGRRKLYVTPGLVDQGEETERIHMEVGSLIGAARPDRVVLMQNSVTAYLQAGLTQSNYSGEVVIETNPLQFYTNLEHIVAAGDLIMLQNDWPDSYR